MIDARTVLHTCGDCAPGAHVPSADGSRFGAALAAALALHIGVFALFVGLVEPEFAGASGAESAAANIEVTLVSARALESMTKSPTHAAATTAFDTVEGNANPTADGAMVTSPAAPTQTSPTAAEAVAADLLTDRRPTAHRSEADTQIDRPNPATPLAASAAHRSGGASARSADHQMQPVTGAAAASPGAVVAYARAVAGALGHSRPKAHHPVGGTVRILFAIGDDGGVDDIVLKRSSGRAALDMVALEAVRRTRFPPPPSSLSAAQRTFEIPYFFR